MSWHCSGKAQQPVAEVVMTLLVLALLVAGGSYGYTLVRDLYFAPKPVSTVVYDNEPQSALGSRKSSRSLRCRKWSKSQWCLKPLLKPL